MKPKKGRYDERIASRRSKSIPNPLVKRFVRTEAKPILEEIHNRKLDDPIRNSLVNYMIVRVVSLFEYYMLTEAGKLADKNKERASELFSSVLLNKEIGDQVTSTFSFLNIESVDYVFSKLIDINFLDAVKNESVDYYSAYSYEEEQIPYTKSLHKNWDDVMKVFAHRHDIVHHNKLFNMKYSQIRDLVGGTLQFLMCSLMIIR